MRRAYHYNSNLVKDKKIVEIISQIMNQCGIINAEHMFKECSIPIGCPIFELLGAIMLKSLDDMIPKQYFYVRYMDDWLIATNVHYGIKRCDRVDHKR